ncbi:MAG: hypothetical protein M3N08_02540 [Pseudomonadota bacterium]|nr:hypothetical protein [Pseudomonadota bacterium]
MVDGTDNDVDGGAQVPADAEAQSQTSSWLANYAGRKNNLVSMKVEQAQLLQGPTTESRLDANGDPKPDASRSSLPSTAPLPVSYADPASLLRNPAALVGFSNAIQPAGGLASRDDVTWLAFMKQDLQSDARHNREILRSKYQSPEAKSEARLALDSDREQFQQLKTAAFTP